MAIRKLILHEAVRGPLRIWEMPVPGAEYVIGGDVALGRSAMEVKKTADQCALVIGRRFPWGLRQVGAYRDHIDVGHFGQLTAAVGFWFNTAWINLERNMVEGARVAMEHCGYPIERFYIPVDSMSVMNVSSQKFFFLTTKQTKKVLLDTLIDYGHNNRLEIADEELTSELSTIQKDERSLPLLNGKDISVACLMTVIADSTLPAPPPPDEHVPTRFDIPWNVDAEIYRKLNGIPDPRHPSEEAMDELPEWEESQQALGGL